MTNTLTNSMNDMPRRTVTGRSDLYRDIHKGLRHVLFDLSFRAGRLDPADDELVVELVSESHRVIRLLREHHKYEEQPAFEEIVDAHVPTLVGRLHDEHYALAERLEWLASRADELAAAPTAARPAIAHAYYLELAAFTGAYLGHLDVEERVVMPALATACADAELDAVQAVALATIPPETRAVAMAVMLPALTPTERAALVADVRATAPPEAFAGVRAIAARVLTTPEYTRLGIEDQ
jgi:hemerythrin-like domain-containing protein